MLVPEPNFKAPVVDPEEKATNERNEHLLDLVDSGFIPSKLDLAALYDPRSQYSPKEKVKACAYYMIYTNSAEVERKTNIPATTVRKWKSETDWWEPTIQWLKSQKQEELDSMLTSVIHEAVDEIRNRIKSGDTVVVKGELKKVPIKAKDLAYLTSIAFDKRALMRGDLTTISQKTQTNLQQIQEQIKKAIETSKEKNVIATVIKEEE